MKKSNEKNRNSNTAESQNHDIPLERENSEVEAVSRQTAKVTIIGYKKMVSEFFPDSLLAQVLAAEPDEMTVNEFLVKATTWMALAKVKK